MTFLILENYCLTSFETRFTNLYCCIVHFVVYLTHQQMYIYIYIYVNVYWTVHHCDSWRIRVQLNVTSYYVLFHFFYAQHVSDINTSIIRSLRLFYCITTRIQPQPSHTETPSHIETRTHDQCGYTMETSRAPDDGCINVRNMLSIGEVK